MVIIVFSDLECIALDSSGFLISFEKSVVLLMGFSLYVICVLSLTAFNTLSLFYILGVLTVIYTLGYFPYWT